MEATIDIPEPLYRDMERRCARHGRTVSAVTVMLYADWLHGSRDFIPVPMHMEANQAEKQPAMIDCFAVGRQFVRRNADGPHDMDSIRDSIAAGGVE